MYLFNNKTDIKKNKNKTKLVFSIPILETKTEQGIRSALSVFSLCAKMVNEKNWMTKGRVQPIVESKVQKRQNKETEEHYVPYTLCMVLCG